MKKVITIDGPSASGKSSVSRELAARLGWQWVSTGAFYRGLAFVALHEKVDLGSENSVLALVVDKRWKIDLTPELTKVVFAGVEVTAQIQGEEIGAVASRISQYPGVRAALLDRQRDCHGPGVGGLIAEGRDCGTVVFPDAFLKVYLTADAKSRAQRRSAEDEGTMAKTLKLQKKRDKNDAERAQAPMKMAQGAILIDSSELALAQVVEKIYQEAKARLAQISF